MYKYTSLLVIAALGISSVVHADTVVHGASVSNGAPVVAARGDCTPKNSNLRDFQSKWPTLSIQTTPDNQIFCADDGALLMRLNDSGILTKVLGIRSFSINHWVPSPTSDQVGYYNADGFLELNVDGTPIATISFLINNYINGKKLCRTSNNPEAVFPYQTTLAFGPNIDMDLNLDAANGRYIIDDRFIYGPIDPVTKLVGTFTNIRNINFATPNTNPSMVEIYFNRKANKQDCPLYNTYFGSAATASVTTSAGPSAGIPNLEDDLSRVWKLEGGVQMTGADIRKALLGY
jgi:hypothetical protein